MYCLQEILSTELGAVGSSGDSLGASLAEPTLQPQAGPRGSFTSSVPEVSGVSRVWAAGDRRMGGL